MFELKVNMAHYINWSCRNYTHTWISAMKDVKFSFTTCEAKYLILFQGSRAYAYLMSGANLGFFSKWRVRILYKKMKNKYILPGVSYPFFYR